MARLWWWSGGGRGVREVIVIAQGLVDGGQGLATARFLFIILEDSARLWR